jgi:alanine dehydrogenase
MTQAPDHLRDLAQRYTAAWCSQDPTRVAAYFSTNGSLRVNNDDPAVGRSAITEVARGFMTTFPDMKLRMDDLLTQNGRVVYHWTLTGTNTGPGGSGHRVRISGFEEWQIDADGLIAESLGHFDAAEYQRQLEHGLEQGMKTPRFFDEDAVRARLRMPDLIEAMERALVEFSAGRVQQPIRTVLEFGAERSLFGLMPSYVPSLPALGAKLVTVCAGNTGRGLGTHQAMIVMLDPVTGVAEAILDGRYITEARTAAVSAVSARRLARGDARVLGILGSGVQARSHYEALGLVREFREVRAWSPTADRLRQFAAETGARAMENAAAVVRGADVVVAVTASPTPVIQSEWVDEGTHVIAVGACRPWQRELDPALVARARLVVDSRAAALEEAGDVVMGIAEGRWTADHVAAELGELPVRRNDREITVFKSLGLAVEDLFAAQLVLTHAGRAQDG